MRGHAPFELDEPPVEIELREIDKSYGRTQANRGISITIHPGTIHGILGENGAGKSTLMKILSGYTPKSSGKILVGGRDVSIDSPADARRLGIGMLYQDPLDFPQLSVLENFALGSSSSLIRKPSDLLYNLEAMASRFGFTFHPGTNLETLTIGERQQLELLRLLNAGTRTLILDEPTMGISSLQKKTLFSALRELAREGRSVILVSHKLEDIETICDCVTVLRNGQVAGSMERPFDGAKLLSLMFGSLPPTPQRCPAHSGDAILRMDRVEAIGGRTGLRPCSLTIRRGEIVGLAGLEGSGQGLFLRVAAGLLSPDSGRIFVKGRSMKGKDYNAFRRLGVTFVPASRLEEGLIPGLSVMEHFALKEQRSFRMDWNLARREAEERIGRFRIRGRPETLVEGLSGGNQQRLLLALLPEQPELLLLEQPTRGLDVESAAWLWNHLLSACRCGTSIVFSSAELDEIWSVSHRIIVFFDGAVTLDQKLDEIDAETVTRAIAGKGPAVGRSA